MVAGTAVSIIGCDWLGVGSAVKAQEDLEGTRLRRFPIADMASKGGSREHALLMLFARWYSSGIVALLIFGIVQCSHSLLHSFSGTVHWDPSALNLTALNGELQRQLTLLQSGSTPALQRLLPTSLGSCAEKKQRCIGVEGPLWKGDLPLLFFSVHVELDKVLGINSLNVSNVILSEPKPGVIQLQTCGRFEDIILEGRATAVGEVTLPRTSIGFCAEAQATCLPQGGLASLALHNATLVGPLEIKLPALLGGQNIDMAALGGHKMMHAFLSPLFHEGSMGAKTQSAVTHWIDANAGGRARWKCA